VSVVKVFGKRGVKGEREAFFQKGFLSPIKYFFLNQMIKSRGISGHQNLNLKKK